MPLKYYVVNKKKKVTTIIFSVFLSIVIVISMTLTYIINTGYPFFFAYGQLEAQKLTTMIINRAIEMEDEIDDQIIDVITNSNNVVSSIQFNTYLLNKVIRKMTSKIESDLIDIESGNYDLTSLKLAKGFVMNDGLVYQMPLGVMFDMPIFANFGPKIPIRYQFIGNVKSQVKTRVTQYGINNVLIEILLVFSVEQQALLPLASDKVVVIQEVPAVIKYVTGEVPSYFLGTRTMTENGLLIPSQ